MNELADANLTQEEYEKDMYDAYLDLQDKPYGECVPDPEPNVIDMLVDKDVPF